MDVDILIFSSAIINVLKKHYFIIFIIDYKNPSIYKFCLNPTIFTVEAMSWQYSKILTSANGATISWWNLSWRFNSVVCVWVFECCPSEAGWQQLLVGANLLWACWQSCFVPNHPSAARPINTASKQGHNICRAGTAAQENSLDPGRGNNTVSGHYSAAGPKPRKWPRKLQPKNSTIPSCNFIPSDFSQYIGVRRGEGEIRILGHSGF